MTEPGGSCDCQSQLAGTAGSAVLTLAPAAFTTFETAVPIGGRAAALVDLPTGLPAHVIGLSVGAATLPPIAPTAVTGGLPATDSTEQGPLRDGQAFGNRYRIIRLLGTGGMGAVYQAWDEELSVALALKVIRVSQGSEYARDLERRFKHELLLARQVTHKNVVRIHDLGEFDGIKYITMPYIKGTDLAHLLTSVGRLPVTRAMRLARQIAQGLAAAHDAGIVHRDLKPANIMVSGTGDQELALIMDFGISASVSERSGGEVTGTLEYMAPEQAAGDAVDGRADVYAFGLILYEMLSGLRGTTGTSVEDRLKAMRERFEEGVPPLRMLAPAVPDPVCHLIDRSLMRDPALRFQSATELNGALGALEDTGERRPIPPRFTPRVIAGAVTAVVLLVSSTWWLVRTPPPPPKHEPVSVVVADLDNTTGDPSFDHSLEPTIKMALEGASFISAFDRTQFRSLGVAPPPKLDEAAAREVALKQGLGIVVAGSVQRTASGFTVALRGQQAVTGAVVGTAEASAGTREQVLAAATESASRLRRSLGDTTTDSTRRFAQETLSSTSLDVVHEYVQAMEAVSNSRFDEARMRFSKAVEIDPKFGLAYAGMAMMSWNLRQQQDAEKSIKEAVRHVDRMTERERYRTRGLFYMITGDDQACVKEYGDLLTRYPADASAHNNLALCSSHVHDWPRALAEMRRVVELLPKRALYRVNLGLYAAYGGDFASAEREGTVARDLGSPLGWLPTALAQVGEGRLDEARSSFDQFGRTPVGTSYKAAGLADLASYEGRFTEAVSRYDAAAEDEVRKGGGDRAAARYAGVAYAELSRGRKAQAIAAAERALSTASSAPVRFQAARLLVEAGAPDKAQPVIDELKTGLLANAQAYSKILAADVALAERRLPDAVKGLTDANSVLDTWIGHFDLGRAYLQAGAFTQADSEFDRCLQRRGEALALFLDEEPTFSYLPPVYYWQGRVREGLQSAGAADSFRAYLSLRGAAGDDPLVADARRRDAQ